MLRHYTFGFAIALTALLSAPAPAAHASTTSRASGAFVLDTRPAALGGQPVSRESNAFPIDTCTIYKAVREGISPPFALSTLGGRVELPPAPLPEPPVLLPPPVAAGLVHHWNAATGSWEQTTPPDVGGKRVFVISHGWNPENCTELPDWVTDMAAAISAREGGDALVLAWDWLAEAYRPSLQGPPTGKVPTQGQWLHNWLKQSPGWASAQGLHLIGFSLGAGVSAHAAEKIVADTAFDDVPKRVTLLDAPEDWRSAVFDRLPGSGPVKLSEIVSQIASGASVENFYTTFGKAYTKAFNVDLRTAAVFGGKNFPPSWRDGQADCGPTRDPEHDLFGSSKHGLAPRWYISTILAGIECGFDLGLSAATPHPSELTDRYFFYHVNGPLAYFCAGADAEGYNRTALSAQTYSPSKMQWTWYKPAGILPAYIGNAPLPGAAPYLRVPEHEAQLEDAVSILDPYLRGYSPFVLATGGLKSIFDFDETLRALIPNLAADPAAWQTDGGAYIEDGALHLETAEETYAYRDVAFPENARLMRVVYETPGAAEGDQFACFIGGEQVFAHTLPGGGDSGPYDSAWLDVSMLAGLNERVTLLARANGDTPVHIRIVSVDVVDVTESYWHQDNDADGLDNYQELIEGTDPNGPDSDGDDHTDYDEVVAGSDPLDINSLPAEITEGEGEGVGDGEGGSEGEGEPAGEPDGEGDDPEGEPLEGEGDMHEGEGAGSQSHSADLNGDGILDLGELLRVIQLYNAGSYACWTGGEPTEDGFETGVGDTSCTPHSADYLDDGDFTISLSELLRVVQLFNVGGYATCPEAEDSFCPERP